MSNPASNYQARPHGAGSLIVTRPIVPADTAAVLTGPLLPHPSSPGPPVPETAVSGTVGADGRRPRSARPGN
jgi:hypothetical protein